MLVLRFIRDFVTRSLFILISLVSVWRVVWVTGNKNYWFLTILYLPLVIELILTIRKRKKENEERRRNYRKWFSPVVFFFLVSMIPSIWILVIHDMQHVSSNSRCNKLDSPESIKRLFQKQNDSSSFMKSLAAPMKTICANEWILALHQILLILLILGKWLLPADEGLSRDQLSQLLLTFVGTAADILEFTSETISDINNNSSTMVYIILAVWTWSMLQFPFLHRSALEKSSEDELESASSQPLYLQADFWSIMEALLIQDGPFLIVRLVVMIHFRIVHQMLIFFAIKNFLVVALNIFRLVVLGHAASSSGL